MFRIFSLVLSLSLLWHIGIVFVNGRQQPNILFILADDLGYADVDWHDARLLTPNLRELAFSQHTTYLANSYVNQLCTPTRSALMTGVYPFRTGTQEGVFLQAEPSGVPLDFTFFPQNLRKIGYRNYMIGKWHLGYCRREYLPTTRGFDYFYGYYGSQEGYFNHSTDILDRKSGKLMRGLDLFREVNGVSVPDFSKNNIYSTQLFTDETIRTLESHRNFQNNPFFLYLAFQSVHSPLQVPSSYESKCISYSHDPRRRTYCGMLYAMDESVGIIINYLKRTGLYRNTVIIFSSDNGGDPTFGASNLPLRGQKNTLWEGGTKTTTFIHAPQFIHKFSYQFDLFHVVDWHATILNIGGIKGVEKYGDGINQWGMILGKSNEKYMRMQFFYNIDSTSAIRRNNYKLVYDIGKGVTLDKFDEFTLRKRGSAQLFDLSTDPYECRNIARQQPIMVRKLIDTIFQQQSTIRRSIRKLIDSQRGDPARMNGAYGSYWC